MALFLKKKNQIVMMEYKQEEKVALATKEKITQTQFQIQKYINNINQ